MFVVIMGLLTIGIAVAWFFSCTGNSPVCQVNQSFSVGAGIIGLICLAMGVSGIVLDRRNKGKPRQPYNPYRPYDPHRDDLYCGRCGSPLPHTGHDRGED